MHAVKHPSIKNWTRSHYWFRLVTVKTVSVKMMLNSHMLQFASAQLDTECANEECSAIFGGVSDKVVCVVIGIVRRCGFMLLNE